MPESLVQLKDRYEIRGKIIAKKPFVQSDTPPGCPAALTRWSQSTMLSGGAHFIEQCTPTSKVGLKLNRTHHTHFRIRTRHHT